MKKISFCLPCYNEEMNIPIIYQQITDLMSNLPQYNYEMIFEDNDSQDNTAKILRALAEEDAHVKVILNNINYGPMRSSKNCAFSASGDVVVSLATDLQTPVDLVPKLLEAWECGEPVVMAQKIASEERSIISKACRKIFYTIIDKVSDIPQYPQVTGFGAIDAKVNREIQSLGDPGLSTRHALGLLGYKPYLVQFTQPSRKYGKSSYNLRRDWEFSIESLVNVSKMPIHMMCAAGLLSIVTLTAIIALFLFASLLQLTTDWFELVQLLLICDLFALCLFCVGLVGEYVLKIDRVVSRNPLVIEKERINFE